MTWVASVVTWTTTPTTITSNISTYIAPMDSKLTLNINQGPWTSIMMIRLIAVIKVIRVNNPEPKTQP